MGKQWKQCQTLFLGTPKSLQMATAAIKLKHTWSFEEKLWQSRQCIKKQKYHFADKGPYSQSYGFSNSHVQMWEFVHKEGWTPKKWCFQIMMLKNTLESPLDCKEVQPVHPEGNQSWVFIGRTDVEAETPILWPPDAKSWFIWKDPDAGKDWGQEENGTAEDEMAGWHHWLNALGFGWTPGIGDRQGSLVCCGSWGCKKSDTTERLNWTELKEEIIKKMKLCFLCVFPLFLIIYGSYIF